MTSIFKAFTSDDIVVANAAEVTVGLFPGDTGSLTSFYTSSQATGSTSGQYYWNVFDLNPTGSNESTCFAVAYGHRTGGGHPTLLQDQNSKLATQAVYSQYRSLLLDPSDTQFTFTGPYATDHIYVINIQRALMKQRLDPGNWQLSLKSTGGISTFIDDSGQSLGSAFGKSGQVFNVVSGSLSGSSGATIYSATSSVKGGFGLFYPSLGLIVLSPDAITTTVGFVSGSYISSGSAAFIPVTGSVTVPQYNHAGLFNAIKLGASFLARSAENITSTYYFIRVAPADFNYSNNPTFYDSVTGNLLNTAFIQEPVTYITQFGLYDDNNECLAVAKPSQALRNGFNRSISVTARLDY